MSLNDPTRTTTKVAVSSWLADALGTALWAARETDGLVDPTVGQCLIDLGYNRSFELLAHDQPLVVRATHVPAWERVSVRQLAARVPAGVRLDLGATAKALCADRAARRASAVTGGGVLVSLGGDIAVSGPAPDDGWAIRVTDRADTLPAADQPGQTVAVRDGGLATSGTTARRWAQEGRARHHLVDPRTASPAAEVWRTVSVADASCVGANVASTAAVIMGEAAPEWLAGRGVHARLVGTDGETVFVGDWPNDHLDLTPPTETVRRSRADREGGAA
jgi:thiamine biosynthesis lipoprotein